MKLIKLIIVILILIPSNSFAEKELKGKFWDWSIYKTNRGDQTICYLASIPIESHGNIVKRGDSYLIVTEIKDDADEISLSSGVYYSTNSDVELSFGLKKFYLFPYKALAWSRNRNIDLDIIKEMQRQEDLVVTGVSKGGKIINDTYSLIGFSKAYDKMRKICK